jgi:Ca-activated chloride channel family protein
MSDFLQNFHFLRPWLLLLLLPAGGVIWYAWRKPDSQSGMRALIAENLLKHLLVPGKEPEELRPIYLLAAFWLVAIVALAGPAWQKEPSPFVQDAAGLVIALKVSPTMLAQDIQPSRLERATQKIHDLLKLRPGSKTALIAYRGSAHLAMPLTQDAKIIDMFSQALNPEIMPETGDVAVAALKLGADLLQKAGIPGAILLIADQIDPQQLNEIRRFRKKTDISVHIYAIAADRGVVVPLGSPPVPVLNLDNMKQAAAVAGASLTLLTPDDYDVKKLSRQIKATLSAAKSNQGNRWQDTGYWFLPIILIFGLFFFRHGWMVAYE